MTVIISGDNGVSDVDGSAGTPAIRGTDANTGIFFGADQVGVATNGVERVEFGNSETVFNDGGADVDFRVEGDTNANLLFVDASTDRIGVGTNAPAVQLHIAGDANADSGTVTNQITLRLQDTENISSGGDTTNPYAAVEFFSSDTSDTARVQAKIGSIYSSQFGDGSHLAFYTSAGGAPTLFERARIDSSGRLLINLTSSISTQAVLQVQQDCSTGVMAEFNNTNTASSDNIIRFRRNGTEAGKIAVTTSNTTQYLTSSDYRLKENIAPMTGALATVTQLNPCTYTWKVDGSAGQGFVAHELQAVVPDCVSGERDAVDADGNPKYQGVDTSFLVATLTAAIQELKAINDAQASRIETLEAKVAALEAN